MARNLPYPAVRRPYPGLGNKRAEPTDRLRTHPGSLAPIRCIPNKTSSRAPAGFDDNAQAANAEFYFRATGYNSSLKKRVVFEGNYIASSAAVQKKAAKAEAEERDEQTRARITGTAKIPGESPLQIDAIAVAK